MTYADGILELLHVSGKRFCDDCMAVRMQMKARQQARSRCMGLAAKHAVKREVALCDVCGRMKICSRLVIPISDKELSQTTETKHFSLPSKSWGASNPPIKPWFWEGHVQRVLVGWLEGGGWDVVEYANTAAKSPGKDIIARQDNRTLWVSVKGFPSGTPNSSKSTQARHWFAHAVFDLIRYRTESPTVELAVGFPECSVTYARLVEKSLWAMSGLPARVLWVSESGKVRAQSWE